MPDWKTHFIFSLFIVIAWITVFHFMGISTNIRNVLTLVTFSTFSSLFPDIDMKRSKIRDFVSLSVSAVVSLIYIINFTSTWFYAPFYFFLIYFILKYIPMKHRGITHRYEFSIVFSVLLTYLYMVFIPGVHSSEVKTLVWFFVILTSYDLHLLIDSF